MSELKLRFRKCPHLRLILYPTACCGIDARVGVATQYHTSLTRGSTKSVTHSFPPALIPLKQTTCEQRGPQSNPRIVGEEWVECYRLTPAERFIESMKLGDTGLHSGGA